ncbi:MAG: glutamine--fructose-6-phosphate transaminase (isomerizing) [Chloroflexi bacterium]|nr:MAG: glutamine--fructose-6-phosphate transaminase (isomerizing) [Chloroflexota bacterium]TMF27328.1 MAG: glutamine--fructose-6-phosphate transaminase (isomerizing) [Chloroflexota bacterium]
MCGIVGYVGPRQALPFLMTGLRRLEYRGYDSAGVAVQENGALEVLRAEGKLDNLASIVSHHPAPGHTGIGHTRWATHGRPSEQNAHPHVDCGGVTAVIHNGIIENFETLKAPLVASGHRFTSETDTEVAVHLLEEELAKGRTLEEAALAVLPRLEGAAALAFISARDPGKIVAARIASAGGVIVGFGNGENFIASDMPALLEHTRKVVFLEAGEVAAVTKDGARFFRIDGTPIEKTPQTVTWDAVAAAKSGYKHFMLKEISEQPRAINDTLLGRVERSSGRVIFDENVKLTDEQVRALPRITLVGCGTAGHAALVGKILIERLAGIPCDIDIPSEYRYRNPVVTKGQLLLAITQSGETADTLAAMEEARKRGARLLSLVNVMGSEASRVADDVIYLHTGPEIAVASTKAYTAMLVDLYLFAIYLAQRRGAIDAEGSRRLLAEAFHLPTLVDSVLREEPKIRALAYRYHTARNFLFLGRGVNYPTALEGALKLKELSYIHAEGTAAGEMKHGTNALIDEDLPVVAIALKDAVYKKMRSNMEEVRARAGVLIALANDDDDEITGKADDVIRIPRTDELLSPVLAVVPLQLLAYHIADRRGNDVDQPRNLAKAVTVE